MYILTDLSRKECLDLKLGILKKLSAVVLATGMMLSALSPVMAAGEERAIDSSVESREPPEPVTVSMQKVSAKPDCTDGNPSYKLEGAEYTIYTDSKCTKSTGKKIVIGKDGKGSVTGLPHNIYWVKETKRGSGFDMDTTAHKVDLRTATSGSFTSTEPPGSVTGLPHNIYWVKETKRGSGFDMDTTAHKVDLRTATSGSFTSTEPPMLDPIQTLIKKEGDFKPDASLGQTLEGARFEVKFYAITPNATVDPATQDKKPKWTWVFKTGADGRCLFLDSYKISGPDLPKDANNLPSLPYGVVTIKEILAPNGFAINDRVFVANIKWDNNSGNMLYQTPTIPEKSIKIKLYKYHEDEETTEADKVFVKGAEFKHTFPNNTTEIVKTDENGELTFFGLTAGKHTLEEVKAPDGFALYSKKIEFTVTAAGKIEGLVNVDGTDKDGTLTVVIDPNNSSEAEIHLGNKPAPFKLNIHKVNDKNASLEGAEFTLYEDDQCTQEVTKATSDASGNLTIENLVVGKTYYLKETKAPAGYKIPINNDGSEIIWKIKVKSRPTEGKFIFYVNDKEYTSDSGQFHISGTKIPINNDGSEIIWKIKVKSRPTEGKFIFYVNDKEYTSDSGQFHISGTPADRIVNMELINTVSGKLPKTGSNAMIIVIITGAILMIGAVIVSRFHKKK